MHEFIVGLSSSYVEEDGTKRLEPWGQFVKNFQVVEGAINSVFEVYEVTDEVFNRLFPNDTDVAFISDFDEGDIDFWNEVYERQVDKKSICGIHGTLHLTGSPVEKDCFPNRRETDARLPYNSPE